MWRCMKVFCSVFVAVVAIIIGVALHAFAIPGDINIQLIEDEHDITTTKTYFFPRPLSKEQIEAYKRDGSVMVRSLLSTEDAAKLHKAVDEAAPRSFSLFDMLPKPSFEKVAFDTWRINEKVASFAMVGLPQIVAELMESTNTIESEDGNNGIADQSSSSTTNFRLLRDAFFDYRTNLTGCGWHVDDLVFWPTMNDTSGVTVWIALNEMKVSEGGGLAIANMSMTADAADNLEGPNPATCFKEIQRVGTCDMETKSPKCFEFFESVKMQWDMQPGDAILWDRWTFHKSVVSNSENELEGPRRRYSVRYMPSTSRAFGAVHTSVTQGNVFDSPYYPQVWPNLIQKELQALEHGLDGDLSLVGTARIVAFLLAKKVKKLIY